MPLAEPDNVLCLAQDGDLSYACNSLGVARVSGPELGESLFELIWLVGPDLTLLEGEARDRCNSQWQDLRLDIMTVGMSLLVDAMPDPGSAAAGAGGVPVAGMDDGRRGRRWRRRRAAGGGRGHGARRCHEPKRRQRELLGAVL